jgi:hypothetical protein
MMVWVTLISAIEEGHVPGEPRRRLYYLGESAIAWGAALWRTMAVWLAGSPLWLGRSEPPQSPVLVFRRPLHLIATRRNRESGPCSASRSTPSSVGVQRHGRGSTGDARFRPGLQGAGLATNLCRQAERGHGLSLPQLKSHPRTHHFSMSTEIWPGA